MSQSHNRRSYGLATDTPDSLERTDDQLTPSNDGVYGTMLPEMQYPNQSLILNTDFHTGTDERSTTIPAGLGVTFSEFPDTGFSGTGFPGTWFHESSLLNQQEPYDSRADMRPAYNEEWNNYHPDPQTLEVFGLISISCGEVHNPPYTWGPHPSGFGDLPSPIPQPSPSSSYTISPVAEVTPMFGPCFGSSIEEPPECKDVGALAEQSSENIPVLERVIPPPHNAVGNGRNALSHNVNLRRKTKVDRRLQVLQNGGGSHIVFDSIVGRQCSAPRARYSTSRRKEVAEVRERGACFKCRVWKRKCDLGTPCSGCKDRPEKCSDAPPLLFSSQPCFRLDLADCGFFRTKSASWKEPLREKMSWESNDILPLQVQCVYRDGKGPQFPIKCRRFKPEDTDIKTRKWGPGGHQILVIPTYCAQDINDIQKQIAHMVGTYQEHILSAVKSGSGSPDTPKVMVKTIDMAMNRQDKFHLLKPAMGIWAGSRFIAAPRSLRGKDTLGLKPIAEEDAHDLGLIPIPPMLDYQLDTTAIRWMEKTMATMLKKLWKTLISHESNSWFDVFLVIFILLNNLEYVYGAQLQYIQQHGAQDADEFRRKIRETSREMLDRWQWTAQHLIFVFKYHIKKCALDDAPLFSEQFSTRASDDAGLDAVARDYLAYMIEWAKNIEAEEPTEISGNQVFQTMWCRKLVRNEEWKKEQQ
ncbi:hypothetical protein K440DRAFT_658658 [Wilcoxina mikolae CBS 423.85]|nr:hypothetical protein K440DRAFT_658658 [Wilcoxina mikolae CBS 423.85]